MGHPTKRSVEKRVCDLADTVGSAEEPQSLFVETQDGEERHWSALYVPRELWAGPGESPTEAWDYLWTGGHSHPELRERYGPPSIAPTRAYIISIKLANEYFDPLAEAVRETSTAESEPVDGDELLSGTEAVGVSLETGEDMEHASGSRMATTGGDGDKSEDEVGSATSWETEWPNPPEFDDDEGDEDDDGGAWVLTG